MEMVVIVSFIGILMYTSFERGRHYGREEAMDAIEEAENERE